MFSLRRFRYQHRGKKVEPLLRVCGIAHCTLLSGDYNRPRPTKKCHFRISVILINAGILYRFAFFLFSFFFCEPFSVISSSLFEKCFPMQMVCLTWNARYDFNSRQELARGLWFYSVSITRKILLSSQPFLLVGKCHT